MKSFNFNLIENSFTGEEHVLPRNVAMVKQASSEKNIRNLG